MSSVVALPATTQCWKILMAEESLVMNVKTQNYEKVIQSFAADKEMNFYAYIKKQEDMNRCNVDVNVNFNGAGVSLHEAVRLHDVEMVHILMRHGANPNLLNQDKRSAYDLAQQICNGKKYEILKIMHVIEDNYYTGNEYADHRETKIKMMKHCFNLTYCEKCNHFRSSTFITARGEECNGTCADYC